MNKHLDILDYYHDCCGKLDQYVESSQASYMGRKHYTYKVTSPSSTQDGWMDLFQIVYGLTVGRTRIYTPMQSRYTESPGMVAIFIVLSGQLNIEKPDGSVLYRFGAGSVGVGCRSCVDHLLLNYLPNSDHTLEAVSIDVPVTFFSQLFPNHECDLSSIKSFPHESCMLKMDHLCRHFAIDVANKIMECDCQNLKDVIYIESIVLDLISKLSSHFNQIFQPCCDVAHRHYRHYHRIRNAINILEGQYDQKHTIASLSRLVGLNECYLKSLFKEQTGQTIAECQRSIRMKKAKYFIEILGCTVMEAAQKVGYNNPGHFAAAFRKEYGLSPSSLKQTTSMIAS